MRSLERVNIRTNVRTYVLTHIRTGQTLYPLHNFVVRGDKNYLTACKPKHNSIMVKGTVNAFDHIGFYLVLNLTTTCTDSKWVVIWPPNFATKYVSFATGTNFYTGKQVLAKFLHCSQVICLLK